MPLQMICFAFVDYLFCPVQKLNFSFMVLEFHECIQVACFFVLFCFVHPARHLMGSDLNSPSSFLLFLYLCFIHSFIHWKLLLINVGLILSSSKNHFNFCPSYQLLLPVGEKRHKVLLWHESSHLSDLSPLLAERCGPYASRITSGISLLEIQSTIC